MAPAQWSTLATKVRETDEFLREIEPRRGAARHREQIEDCAGLFDRLAQCVDASRHVSTSHPLVKDRINCVNAKACNAERDRRLLIDPLQSKVRQKHFRIGGFGGES